MVKMVDESSATSTKEMLQYHLPELSAAVAQQLRSSPPLADDLLPVESRIGADKFRAAESVAKAMKARIDLDGRIAASVSILSDLGFWSEAVRVAVDVGGTRKAIISAVLSVMRSTVTRWVQGETSPPRPLIAIYGKRLSDAISSPSTERQESWEMLARSLNIVKGSEVTVASIENQGLLKRKLLPAPDNEGNG